MARWRLGPRRKNERWRTTSARDGRRRSAAQRLRPLCTTARSLAEALDSQGRLEEASESCRWCAERAASDDFSAQILWRSVSAKIKAREGESAVAEARAREAVDLAADTDALNRHGEALLDL